MRTSRVSGMAPQRLSFSFDVQLDRDENDSGICTTWEAGASKMSGPFTHIILAISFLPGGALLRRADVNLVVLEASKLLVDEGEDPSRGADSGGLQKKADSEKNVGDGAIHEGQREGRRDKLPRDRGNDRGDHGCMEPS